MTAYGPQSRRALATALIAAATVFVATAPAQGTAAHTRAVFDFNSTEIAAFDGDDVYITRDTRKGSRLFRTDWNMKDRVLIWSQSFPGPAIASVTAHGGKVALSLWNQTAQSGTKRAPDRIDTSVGLVERDGSNPRIVATASLLSESMEEEKIDNEPVSCGTHVEVASLSDDGTLFVDRAIGTRISKMCNGSANVNEYRIERLGADGTLSTHFSERENINVSEDPFEGDVSFGGLLEMSIANGFAVIGDGDTAAFEQLDSSASRTDFRSPIHKGNGFFRSTVRSDGSILVNDWRLGDKEPREKKRIFLLASPHAKPKRVAPQFLDAEGIDCGGLIAVWRDDEFYIKKNRVWLYSAAGDFRRVVKVPKYTGAVYCSGSRLVTIQLKSQNRAVLTTLKLQ